MGVPGSTPPAFFHHQPGTVTMGVTPFLVQSSGLRMGSLSERHECHQVKLSPPVLSGQPPGLWARPAAKALVLEG